MKIKLLVTSLLLFSNFLASEELEEVRLLRQQIKETQNLTIKQQKIIDMLTAFVVEQQQQQQRHVQNIQEAQREWELTPWYTKAWVYTTQGAETFLFRYLIPSMVSQIASQVAGEANQFILGSIDKFTGDLCEQYLSKDYAFRPGERLILTPEGRKLANFKRLAQQDPELVKLYIETTPYEGQVSLSQYLDQERKRNLMVKAQRDNQQTLDQIRELDSQSFLNFFKQQAQKELKEKKQERAVTQEQKYAVRIIENNWKQWREKNKQPFEH